MKKLLLSLFTIINLTAFAQSDLGISLVAPTNGQVIVNNTPFNISFRLFNAGVDTIKAQDTIVASILVNFQLVLQVRINRGATSINPNDSVLVGFQIPGFNITEDSDSIAFCVVASFIDSNIVDSFDNNIDCSLVNFRTLATALSEAQLLSASVKAYPNPANSYFTITMKSSDALVEVMDITGKLVSTNPVVMGEARMDVSSYNNGVYFYQVKDANGSLVKTGKFTVSH